MPPGPLVFFLRALSFSSCAVPAKRRGKKLENSLRMSRALVAAAAGTRESPYSRFLPYGESVPAEALAQFDVRILWNFLFFCHHSSSHDTCQHFERLISDVIVAQDPFPALGGLCHRFEQ